jgi:PAS domain S-box-containing protein
MKTMNLISKDNFQAATPASLSEWRQVILDWVLRGVLIFWLIAMVWRIVGLLWLGDGAASAANSWGITAVYLTTILITLSITFLPAIPYKWRAAIFLALLYFYGVLNLVWQGDGGEDRLYLLAFVAMTAVFFDLKRSIYTLILSFITITLLHILQMAGFLNIVPSPALVPWVNGGFVFVVLSVIIVISITYLIQSLETSLTQAKREQAFVSAILEQAGALIVIYSPDGRIRRFNNASQQLTGYAGGDLVDQFVWDHLLTPDGADLVKTAFHQIESDHQPVSFEGYWLTKTGERRLIAWTNAPLIDENGRIDCIISTGVDVTGYKETEADRSRLLAAEHEQRLLAESLAEVTLSLTARLQPEDVLDDILSQVQRIVPFKAAHIMLIEGETLRAVRWQGYEAYDSEEAIANLVQPLSALPLDSEVIETRTPIVIADTQKDARWQAFTDTAWIRSHLCVPILRQETVLGLLRLDGDSPGAFTGSDAARLQNLANTVAISLANARLMQETQQKARQVQRILNTVQDGILLLDERYRVELANPAAKSYLPALSDTPLAEPLKQLAGVPIRDVLKPPADGALWHELANQKTQQTFEAVAQPIETERGGWVLVLRDVSEFRKQQQYTQAQERLAMVGQMAAGIAHDFNNIMTVIILYTQMLLKSPELPPALVQRMETIYNQSRLASNLIAQILDFSRQTDMKRRTVHLRPFLKELTKLLKRTLPENIDLHFDFDDGEYVVHADLTRMQQVVMNLALNARDAMPDGGTLSLDLAQISVEEDETKPLPDMPAGEWVRLQVIDSGIGIAPGNLDRIFEPLFTTKERGQGTGLGLAQVYGIVKQHEGFVDVDSVVGAGTTFTIYLPVQTSGDQFAPEVEQVELVGGRGEKILVVEDDQITREAISAILQTFNYQTTEAADAQEAIRLFEFFGDEFSLVVSDMVLPGMNGDILLTHLQDKRPDMRMIIVTGYPFAEPDLLTLSEGIVDWIQKPFDVETLLASIQRALIA